MRLCCKHTSSQDVFSICIPDMFAKYGMPAGRIARSFFHLCIWNEHPHHFFPSDTVCSQKAASVATQTVRPQAFLAEPGAECKAPRPMAGNIGGKTLTAW